MCSRLYLKMRCLYVQLTFGRRDGRLSTTKTRHWPVTSRCCCCCWVVGTTSSWPTTTPHSSKTLTVPPLVNCCADAMTDWPFLMMNQWPMKMKTTLINGCVVVVVVEVKHRDDIADVDHHWDLCSIWDWVAFEVACLFERRRCTIRRNWRNPTPLLNCRRRCIRSNSDNVRTNRIQRPFWHSLPPYWTCQQCYCNRHLIKPQ